ENREPRESRLIDLEDEPLEQLLVAPDRESVFPVVIGAVPGMTGGEVAVGHGGWSVGRVVGWSGGRVDTPILRFRLLFGSMASRPLVGFLQAMQPKQNDDSTVGNKVPSHFDAQPRSRSCPRFFPAGSTGTN